MAKRSAKTKKTGLTYADAGVDIDAGDAAVERIQSHLRRTYGPRVLGKDGAFAGMFRLDYNEQLFQKNYRDPVLVACADGVGSKILLALQMDRHDTVGQDLVAMNVNDLVVQGAEPLMMLDYIAAHRVEPAMVERLVKGVADGCELAGCALIGGETAELPDLYAKGEYDLAGFAVGVVELSKAMQAERVEPGDVVLGLASSGVHSNGFSLVHAVIKRAKLKLDKAYPEVDADRPLGEVLLTPTRIYARSVVSLLSGYKVKKPITSMAHITGGGLPGNLPRTLPDDVDAVLSRKAWDVPPVFKFLQSRGTIDHDEMLRVFNMGVGYTLTVRPHFAEAVVAKLKRLGETVYRLGEIAPGQGRLRWVK